MLNVSGIAYALGEMIENAAAVSKNFFRNEWLIINIPIRINYSWQTIAQRENSTTLDFVLVQLRLENLVQNVR